MDVRDFRTEIPVIQLPVWWSFLKKYWLKILHSSSTQNNVIIVTYMQCCFNLTGGISDSVYCNMFLCQSLLSHVPSDCDLTDWTTHVSSVCVIHSHLYLEPLWLDYQQWMLLGVWKRSRDVTREPLIKHLPVYRILFALDSIRSIRRHDGMMSYTGFN